MKIGCDENLQLPDSLDKPLLCCKGSDPLQAMRNRSNTKLKKIIIVI